MKKGRSTYTLKFNCDKDVIKRMMESYIEDNKFKKDKDSNYKIGNIFFGYRFLNYEIKKQTVIITAWTNNLLFDLDLEKNISIGAINFKNSLNTLFQEIININNAGSRVKEEKFLEQENLKATNRMVNRLEKQMNKKKSKMGEICFWISLFGLILAIIDFTYLFLLYIVNIYFAYQELKNNKKLKNYLTIILSILSIIIILI